MAKEMIAMLLAGGQGSRLQFHSAVNIVLSISRFQTALIQVLTR